MSSKIFMFNNSSFTEITYQGGNYSAMPEEGIILNALAMVLVALGILLSYAVRRDSFRTEVKTFVSERL
uniref:Uncharacterized protein n=1 Tax=Timema poppense TaxID=170557 RepID=A0A7R9DI02_TIMPO|nr:unnamed protein product [Timema poppensis]